MRKWLFVLMGILLIVLFKAGDLAYSLFAQKHQIVAEGTKLAKQYSAIAKIEEVNLYNGKESFLVVQGTSAQDIPMIAWFKDGQSAGFEYKKDIVSKEDILLKIKKLAPNAETIQIHPGMDQHLPLWEAIFKDQEGRLNYYYYNMKNGTFLRSYRLQKEVS